MPGDRQSFHSRTNHGIAIVGWAVSGVVAVSMALDSRLWALEGIPLLGAYAFWLAFWMPRVHVDDDGSILVNALRTVRVPWAALIQVETRYALTLRTPSRSYSATAAPAPGSFGTYSASRDVVTPRNSEKGIEHRRPSDLDSTDSGAAARLVLDRWDERAEARGYELGVAETTPVQVTWHTGRIAVLAVLVAASVVGILTSSL
jgi:hypothetical protein